MPSSDGQLAPASLDEDKRITKPRVIPQNQLVILRESELSTDLATAIQQVRETEKTSGSRILIVAPDEEMRPKTDTSGLPMPSLPMSLGQVARSGGQAALEQFGSRLAPKLSSLSQLFDEVERVVDDLEESVQDGITARLPSRVETMRSVLGWLRASAEDLDQNVGGLLKGFQEVDVLDLLQDLQGQVESFFPGIRINVAPAVDSSICWGRATDLCEALFLALVLTVHRIRGSGAVNVEVSTGGRNLSVRIVGLGETHDMNAQPQIERLCAIVVTQHKGRIIPDALGPAGSGLVVELPTGP